MCGNGGCGGCNPFPAAGSEIFLELKIGDEIKVDAGRGFPPVEIEATKIIADVAGYSALTADGVALCCEDAQGIIKTGNYFDKVEISPAAQKLLDDIKQQQLEQVESEDD
jgi:hypothetical protein